MKREKECTYDAIVRRRGPGRKNKSAQETARVQLANRQKEEADRETALQVRTRVPQAEVPPANTTKAAEKELKDASSQTSPRLDRYAGSEVYRAQPGTQYRTPQDSPGRGPQEYQAFSIPYEQQPQQQRRETRKSGGWQPEVFPPSMAQQQYQQQNPARERLPYGLQTPTSMASLSYYDGSPDHSRVSSSSAQQYASSSRGRYPSGGKGDDARYSTGDSDSVYAYSEGANVVPSRYGQSSTQGQPPREAAPMQLRRVAAEYHSGRVEGSNEVGKRNEKRR